MISTRSRDGLIGALTALSLVGAFQLGRARADGIPTAPTMYFGATIEEAGVPVNAMRDITVRLYDAETAGTLLCQTIAPGTAVTAGRMRVALDAACTTAVQQNPNVWSELVVGTTTIGRRSKLGAVPYAVEAQRANDLTAAALARMSNPDCPGGYTRDTTDPSINATMRLCVRTVTLGGTAVRDEVVRVGTGSSAFWIDRYESAVIQSSSGVQVGTATTNGGGADDILAAGLPRNGQRPRGIATPVQALSHPGMPSVNVTWFQANEACAAAGKQLPSGSQWLRAASGTDDGTACNTTTTGARASAPSNGCVSASGAHDMIGNIWEWTEEWFATVNTAVSDPIASWPDTPGTTYAGDGTGYIISRVYPGGGVPYALGLPAAAARGGRWSDGPRAGVFDMDVGTAPSSWGRDVGFRCVIPRP